MIITAYNPRMIGLGTVAPAMFTATNAAQGLALLAVIGIDTALEQWQDWSDRTFCDIRPEILSIIESACYLVRYIAVMAWGYSRMACLNTWDAWMASAPERAMALDVMGQHWAEVRFWLSVAYSAVAVAVVIGGLTGLHVLRQSPRWAGRAIAFALCVE
jgi:hypothetical protein